MANPLETTIALNSAFLDVYDLDYENSVRAPIRPPAPVVKAALNDIAHASEPGMFEEGYEHSSDEIDYSDPDSAATQASWMANLVTDPEYVCPRRIRCRMPSGPYRILSANEKATITL